MMGDIPAIVLLHAGCATLYLLLVGLILARRPWSRTALWLAAASLATAVWAAAVAWQWEAPTEGLAGWLELARWTVWYGFLLHLYLRSVSTERHTRQVLMTLGFLALLVVGGMPLVDIFVEQRQTTIWLMGTAARMGFAVGGLLLLENLYFNTSDDSRWHISLLCVALGSLFLYDLMLYADAALFRQISRPLLEGRAPATALAVPLIAITAARERRWKIALHISRGVVFHSFTLVLSGVFLLGLAATGEVLRVANAAWGQVAEVSLLFAGMLTIAVLLTSGSVRSHIRFWIVDNFFTHRYDYRLEWIRCIDTLTTPETHVGLPRRAIRAVAEVVDSPAGALFVRAPEEVAFQWAGSWNMPAVTTPIPPGHSLVPAFRDGDWTVVFDGREDETLDWFPELPRAWLAVPLNHFGSLIGFVVLAHPRAQFKLDREVYDLLRVIGREVASRVAEQRAAQILSQTRELREYGQRFAFVIHDIKNVSGQLSMLLTNAEVHASNPEFQRDMLATVRASVAKITRLLSRLQAERQERTHALIAPVERLRQVTEAVGMARRVPLRFDGDDHGAGIAIDPEAFDAVMTHLINNAIEASPADAGVDVRLRDESLNLVIDISDQGHGMSPEFVRDELFRPFSTTKSGGHGIGAYQARELLREAGGDLLVLSRVGKGTTMRVMLPSVRTSMMGAAPA